jgi:hypothetical protein
MKPVHSQRLERWLGADRVAALSANFKDWYGPPVHILDLPGSVRVCPGGDFIGPFEHGYFASAFDNLADMVRRFPRRFMKIRPNYGTLNAGFTSVSDALSEASGGKGQILPFVKNGATGVVAVTNSLFGLGAHPAAGANSGAAPGGTICTSATTGALAFTNASGGDTAHLVSADVGASVINNSLMLYDRLFGVNKTMASTATEAVTGVPTRYQSTTAGAADYIGGNFGFVEVGGTALAATAHNWTTCTYLDQANAASTLPSLTGNSGAIVRRLDHPVGQWFAPLATGDTGIKAWTQMQCSASVATGVINFVIGHPIAVMAFPVANLIFPFNWLTARRQAPRIFDDACLAFLELTKPATTATNYTGNIEIVSG